MVQTELALSRRSDPKTSKVSARKAVTFKSSHEGKIWTALEAAGELGVTQNEIPGLSPVQANRRFLGMAKRGLIERRIDWQEMVHIKRNGCCVWFKA